MLVLDDIEVVYDKVILVLKGVSLTARTGAITTLLGANGAGKTTTLKAISCLLNSERGAVTRGTISLDGTAIGEMAPHEVVKFGVVQVFEGRRVFQSLTVEENLIVGAHTVTDKSVLRDGIEQIYTFFPRLRERRLQQSGYLSGGEQQMLAIGRALMSNPRVVLLDEPSLGLAPMVVEEIFEIVRRLTEARGLTVLLVEQNAELALDYAAYGYVLENGRIALEGEASRLRDNDDVKEFYLGLNKAGVRTSYRDVKTYKRPKKRIY